MRGPGLGLRHAHDWPDLDLRRSRHHALSFGLADFLYRLFAEEGKGKFSARMNVLGHMQQGGYPSPFDRNFGTKMAAKANLWMIEQIGKNLHGKGDKAQVSAIDKESACLLGMRGMRYQFQPLEDLKAETNFELRTWKVTWWMNQRSIMKVSELPLLAASSVH